MIIEKTELDDVYLLRNLLPKCQHSKIYDLICYKSKWNFSPDSQDDSHAIDDTRVEPYFAKVLFAFNPVRGCYEQSSEEDWYAIVQPLVLSVSTQEWFRPIIRVKANLYPKTEKRMNHSIHTDFLVNQTSSFPWNSDLEMTIMVYMVNSNDGYTEIFEEDPRVKTPASDLYNDSFHDEHNLPLWSDVNEDGVKTIKIPSVENTAVIFPNKYTHRATTATNAQARFTINCNLL